MSDESRWEQQLRERLHDVFVAEAGERLDALDAALLTLEGGGAGPDSRGLHQPPLGDYQHHLSEAFRQAHTLKGGARAAGLTDVERVAHSLESAFDRLRHGAPGGPDTWGAIYAGVDAIRALIGGQGADVERIVGALATSEPAAAPPAPPATEARLPVPPGGAAITVRVPMARLERLMAEVRVLHGTIGGLRQRAAEARSLAQSTSRLGRFLRYRRRRRAFAAGVPAGLTVPDDGLALIDEFGGFRRRLDVDVHRLEQAAGELYETIRRLRLVPVGVAVAGLPRLVRDIATACGKQARFELVGEDTEVDRSVLEEIGGALTHLVRNAVDHGLEDAERRRAQGKPAVGVVTVAAREERGTLILEVTDDGGGIDAAAVRRRGVELGLVSAEQAEAAGLDLVFRAGFSTAGRITEVSGRGVGLDAVRATVESLQGTVTLQTTPGWGTTFTMTLPITLATTRCLLLRAGGQTLALPLGTVSRVVRISEGEIDRTGDRAVLRAADPPVALDDLAAVLGLRRTADRSGDPGSAEAASGPFRLAVVPASGTTPGAVLVDEIRGEEEVVVNSLPAPLRHLRFTAGAAVLGTGEVVPVLHAGEVFRAAAGQAPPAAPAALVRAARGSAPAPSTGRVVVLADDSVTTRTLERVILEAAGYEVRTAADGAQALAMVQAGGCHAVVTDVQMPVLDGFALCERLRADTRFRHLPVVIVTSRGSPTEREQGEAVGADAYIVKGEFDQETLLATLRRLT